MRRDLGDVDRGLPALLDTARPHRRSHLRARTEGTNITVFILPWTALPVVSSHKMPSAQAPYTVRNVPLGTHRPVRVVCIGAGYSGLMMAIIAKEKMQHHEVDFQVYERNSDLGGTWLLNR